MSFFVRSTTAPVPKTANVWPISLLLAVVLAVMAVAQLFSFETFNDVVAAMVGIDSASATVVAAAVVIGEVAALPFLFRMVLSPAARVLSMAAGWTVTFGWFVIALRENVHAGGTANAGLLGSTVAIPSGWWAVFFGLGLCVLSAWASWGMWPAVQLHKK